MSAFDTFSGYPELKGDSANCKFQIADVTLNGSPIKLFFKIVNYDSQNRNISGNSDDLVIYDVVNSKIIKKILKRYQGDIPYNNDPTKFFKLSDHIPIFVNSTLSYYKILPFQRTYKYFWDYNEIKYSKDNSPYSYNTVINDTPAVYNHRCIVLSYVCINMISFERVFINYSDLNNPTNERIALNALLGYMSLLNSLLFIGSLYGFIHNDLHSGNIIFNLDTNKLMFIDFGRTNFKKFIDDSNAGIDDAVDLNVFKLGYDDMYPRTDLSSYNKLYSIPQLFKHRLANKYSNIYIGVVFDLITLTLHTYIKMIFFFSIKNPRIMEPLIASLSTIIKIDYDGNPRNLIDDFNFRISTVPTLNRLFDNYRHAKQDIRGNQAITNDIMSLFDLVLDYLFITALFLHSKGLQNRLLSINPNNPMAARPFHWALQIVDKNCKVDDFYAFINNLYENDDYRNDLQAITVISIRSTGGGISEKEMDSLQSSKRSSIKKKGDLLNNYVDTYNFIDKYKYYEEEGENNNKNIRKLKTFK